MNICYRNFQQQDQQQARRLILTGLGEHFGFVDETCNPDLEDIFQTYIAAGHIFLVAEQNGELIGTGALVLHNSEMGELVRISVAPAYRRLGIGKALVQALIDLARQKGLTQLKVETNRNWDSAITLYKQFGFSEYKVNATQIFMSLSLG